MDEVKGMAVSEAQKRASKKWNDANMRERYDRIQIVVPKGEKAVIKAAAEECGEKVSEFIRRAVEMRIESQK